MLIRTHCSKIVQGELHGGYDIEDDQGQVAEQEEVPRKALGTMGSFKVPISIQKTHLKAFLDRK